MVTRAMPRMNGWGKVLAVAIPLATGGLVGWGSINADVSRNTKALESVATKEAVTALSEDVDEMVTAEAFDLLRQDIAALHEEIRELRRLLIEELRRRSEGP